MQSSHKWIWQQNGWPRFRWDDAALCASLARARMAQGRLLGSLRLLDASLSMEAFSAILAENGINTSAIEGERLDPAAVRSSVARQLGLPTLGLLNVPRHIDGLIEVLLDATRHHDKPLSIKRLSGWQAALFPSGYSGLYRIRVGALRGIAPMQVVSGSIGHERVHFTAPPRAELELEMEKFLAWFNAFPGNLDGPIDGLVRAGLSHLWFVTIHPFEDGNGRIARAITDMALSQDEGSAMRSFSLSAQMMRERKGYYDILEQTQQGSMVVTAWLEWFLLQVAASAGAAEQTVANTLAKARFWLHHKHTRLNERQHKVMNRLLDAGNDGFEGGINTRKYMSMTKASRVTAYRELTDLVEKGCLVATSAGGRSSAYVLVT